MAGMGSCGWIWGPTAGPGVLPLALGVLRLDLGAYCWPWGLNGWLWGFTVGTGVLLLALGS